MEEQIHRCLYSTSEMTSIKEKFLEETIDDVKCKIGNDEKLSSKAEKSQVKAKPKGDKKI